MSLHLGFSGWAALPRHLRYGAFHSAPYTHTHTQPDTHLGRIQTLRTVGGIYECICMYFL